MSSVPSLPMQQACAIPFRLVAGKVEVCVVTTIKKRRWSFPKGMIEPGEAPPQTALKEAWEEAGLRGRVIGDLIGSYVRKKYGIRLLVKCYLMHVNSQHRRWRESQLRERAWLPLDEALTTIDQVGQRKVLAAAQKVIQQQKPTNGRERGAKG